MIKLLYPFRVSTARHAFSLLLLALPLLLTAQTVAEDCNNGIDDDGDGLIDCYDQDCTCTGQCDNFYYTTCNADCFFVPPCDSITLGVQWVGQAETGTYSPLVAGDMDRDGIPEIVTYRVEGSEMYIIDGATGATKVQIINPTILPGGTAPAMADLDNDGFGEFVIVGNDRLLRCYDHTGALQWTGPTQVGYGARARFAVPNIADFDHDGFPEINIGNQVFSGQTGDLLASGGSGASSGEHPSRVAKNFSFASPVAIDALPDAFCPDCAGLEIVAGNQVLSVNLVTGTVTPVVAAPAGYSDGFTSIADFDRDGDLDALVQGKKNNLNTVYCWDIQTSAVLREYQLLSNWGDGASRVNIADLNGDGQLEISFVGYPWLYALKNDFTPLWTLSNSDVSSITCSSVYDFCGDGSADVIYRGQTKLQVIEGATGLVKWEDDCLSATHIENPLVLDVDGDGQTEIVIECGSNGTPNLGTVVAYEAVGLPGISSRRVWNQHAYFNTNINEDLSVPRIQQNPNIVGDSLRMNSFLNQYFNPTFPSPDGALSAPSVVCVGDSIEISITVCNAGDNTLPLQTPVSAYRGNPQTGTALWLGLLPLGFDLAPDSCRTFTARLPRVANDSVFVVLNDNHSKVAPFSLDQDFPVTNIGECAFLNNITAVYFPYNPPVLNIGPDTLICDNATLLLDAAGTDLIAWQWQDNSVAPDFLAPDAGTYAVTVTDICGLTQTDSRTVGIDSSTVLQLGADQVICQGETVSLGQGGFDAYAWSPAQAVNCAACQTVAAGPASSGVVALTASLNNGCFSVDSVYFTVYDTFNYHIDTTICYGRTVDWFGTVIPPDSNVTFALQTVHGCDSTVQVRVQGTPIGTFQITVDTAVCLGEVLPYNGFDLLPGESKTFFLTAFTGCDSTVMVHVLPKDTFSTAENPIICAGESFSIFGLPQSVTGIYRQTFTARNGCDSTHTVNLTVLPPIQIAIDATPTCPDESDGVLAATVTGGVPPYSYAWSVPGDTQPVSEDLPAGNFSLTITDARDCTKTAAATVPAYPAIEFVPVPDSVQCFGQQNGAIRLESPDPALVYSLDGNDYGQVLEFDALSAGAYTVYAQDVHGCIETQAVTVSEPPEVVLQLPEDATILLGDSIPLPILLPNADLVQYAWNDTRFLSCIDCPNPVARPLDDIHYVLTVTNASGCSDTDDMYLRVDKKLLAYVPNAIAPSAPTDLNWRFNLSFGPSVERIRTLQIFDRWGALVYELRDGTPNDNSQAWNGSWKGKPAPPGVYVWFLELELVDGRSEQLSGDLTVFR
ncbi:MAG: gliding motility-associated C-terminal domain-containing protein [Saprospiraceae bacterium]|nr:gliding motility-associated C-terminal domain-containing protein [Saprospiraceae bacterium]